MKYLELKRLIENLNELKNNREKILDYEFVSKINKQVKLMDNGFEEYSGTIYGVEKNQRYISKLKDSLEELNVDKKSRLYKKIFWAYTKNESLKKKIYENYDKYTSKLDMVNDYYSKNNTLDGLEYVVDEIENDFKGLGDEEDRKILMFQIRNTFKHYTKDKESNLPNEYVDYFREIGKYKYLEMDKKTLVLKEKYNTLNEQLNTVDSGNFVFYDDRKNKNEAMPKTLHHLVEEVTKYIKKEDENTKLNIYLTKEANRHRINVWTNEIYLNETEHSQFYKKMNQFCDMRGGLMKYNIKSENFEDRKYFSLSVSAVDVDFLKR